MAIMTIVSSRKAFHKERDRFVSIFAEFPLNWKLPYTIACHYEETVNGVLKICKQKARTSKSIETLCQLW
ncbi:hypothetical protein B23_1381 [Geobacillus thermoleovorans B23]|nr:hypothetical protein B23_1381 [Geobacillus thermoleovorans B23]